MMSWGDDPVRPSGDPLLAWALAIVSIALLVCVLFVLGVQL